MLLKIYFSNIKNDVKIRAKVIKKIHLINDFKIKILLKINIIKFEKINIIIFKN